MTMSTFNDLKAAVSLFSTLTESQYQIKPGGNLSDEISKNALHIDDNSFCYHWYNFNRGIINAIKLDQKEKLADKLFKLLEILEDNDDVQGVSSNFEVDEDVMSSLTS